MAASRVAPKMGGAVHWLDLVMISSADGGAASRTILGWAFLVGPTHADVWNKNTGRLRKKGWDRAKGRWGGGQGGGGGGRVGAGKSHLKKGAGKVERVKGYWLTV